MEDWNRQRAMHSYNASETVRAMGFFMSLDDHWSASDEITVLESELRSKMQQLRMAASFGRDLIAQKERLEQELCEIRVSNQRDMDIILAEKRALEQRVRRMEVSLNEMEADNVEKQKKLMQFAERQNSWRSRSNSIEMRQYAASSVAKHRHKRSFSELNLVFVDDDTSSSLPTDNNLYFGEANETPIKSGQQPLRVPVISASSFKYLSRSPKIITPIAIRPYSLDEKGASFSQKVSDKIRRNKSRIFCSRVCLLKCKKNGNGNYSNPVFLCRNNSNHIKETRTIGCDAPLQLLSANFVSHISLAPVENGDQSLKNESAIHSLETEYSSLVAILQSTRHELNELKELHAQKTISQPNSFSPTIQSSHASFVYESLEDELESLQPIKNVPVELSAAQTSCHEKSASGQLRDAHLEYFVLTVLAMKQASGRMEKLHTINPMDLWDKAISLRIEFKNV